MKFKETILSTKLIETHQFEYNIYIDAFGNKTPTVQWYKYIKKRGNHEIDDVNVEE